MTWAGLVGCLAFAGLAVGACSGQETPALTSTEMASDASVSPGVREAGQSKGDDGTDASFLNGNRDTGPGGPGASDASLFNDASLDVNAGDACVRGDAGPPPIVQRCAPAVSNECSGSTDPSLTAMGVPAARLNGLGGNGFDDDCDGLVDEGCACQGNGQTKDCYLVPATQTDPATGKPAGWCAANAKGSLDCAGAEFPAWSGSCRGAQPPYRHDVCGLGDFNCDGLEQNSDVEDCRCKPPLVQCPTEPIVVVPYPPPTSIPLVDGSQWITDASARAATTNWSWTVIGGDCDNVLPHPTFALYNQSDSAGANARKGSRTPLAYDATQSPARYVPTPPSPLIGIRAEDYGSGVAGGQVHPAFGLSGDYVVQGEWDLMGAHYVCSQKVQVRAPGIRAELCWDTVGGPVGNDIDLHFARLQGVTCSSKGWSTTCLEGGTYEDCWYSPASGCRDTSSTGPNWGYADSAQAACVGWSSRRHDKSLPAYPQGCTNPRLDKDNYSCDVTVANPIGGSAIDGEFCGPENINIDNPNDGDTFVVGAHHFKNHGGTSDVKPHLNLYCNGLRVLSAGYNPLTGQTSFPLLKTDGNEAGGDFWTAATIKAHVEGGQLTRCDVIPVVAHHADPTRDGPAAQPAPNDGAQVCVDSRSNATPAPNAYAYTSLAFVENTSLQGSAAGGIPATPAGFCKH